VTLRRAYALAAAATIALGLASRRPGAPAFVVAYVGDALYAVLIYWLVAFVRPSLTTRTRAAIAWGVCALIEASQAVHPEWLDALRAHRLVALVLGRGFLWSDLLCYAAGVLTAVAIDRAATRARR